MYERILIPVDGSATSNESLYEGIKLAKLTGACIRLVHVVDETPFVPTSSPSDALVRKLQRSIRRRRLRSSLSSARKMASAKSASPDSVRPRGGKTASSPSPSATNGRERDSGHC